MDPSARSSWTPELKGVSSVYIYIFLHCVFETKNAKHPKKQQPRKVFVTHGGLGSLVEAIYHKAVIVGVPLRCNLNEIIFSIVTIFFHSNDQKPNLLRAVKHGYAVSLVWDDMTGVKTLTFFGTKFCALFFIGA